MPTNDLDAITARADAATPDTWVYHDDTMNSDGTIQSANVLPVGILGPNAWQVAACTGGPVEPQDGDDTRGRQAARDAEFIAHSRQNVPSLVAEVRELRARISQAADALADDRRDPETQDRIAYDILTEGSELADATEPGYMGAYPGTPGEFAARWNAWDQERRAEWLRRRVQSAETASLCLMQDHAGALYQATEVLPNALHNERIATRAAQLLAADNWRLRKLLKRRMHGREFRRKVQGGRR